MIWLLAALDLAAGVYLLRRALPRQHRDRDAVLAVGAILLLCAAALVGIGAWRVAAGPSAPPPAFEPIAPGPAV